MNRLLAFFENLNQVFVHQSREWGEIITGFETRNKYKVLDESAVEIGFIAEQRKGVWAFLLRSMLRSHRPMHIKVWNQTREEILDIERPFHFFFSDMTVRCEGKLVGHIKQRFGLLFKKYDITDERENIFARVRSPLWRLWTFKIFDSRHQERGVITKKWGGFMREIFTDEDKFKVEFSKFKANEKAMIFATAITIDLDYFEENQSNRDGVI
jgi:uncharacterized protein YxjI